jgi:hypothetical protein
MSKKRNKLKGYGKVSDRVPYSGARLYQIIPVGKIPQANQTRRAAAVAPGLESNIDAPGSRMIPAGLDWFLSRAIPRTERVSH